MRRSLHLGALGLIALLAGGCGGEEETDATAGPDTTATDTATATTAPPARPPLADPEIVAVLAASDSAEIRPSQLAAERAQNAQLKEYARMMLRDHGMLSDSMRALAQQNGITPAPNAASQQMESQTQGTLQSLQGLSGAPFDSAYAHWMVQSHTATLSAIDQQLLPGAQNPQLRAAIEQKIRPAVQTHLQQIQQIQGSIGRP